MKKINHFVLFGAVALSLAGILPTLASAHTLSLGNFANVAAGEHAAINVGSLFNSDKKDDQATSTTTKNNLVIGTVSSVDGSTFTVRPIGTKATTTVTTSSSTVFKVNGNATSSNALVVGSRVLIDGAVNGSATIAASIVNIFSFGFGFFKHFWR